ncbi:MAG: T9SS type A sorting domain-containing protein, partial [Bacteroidota bacterium]|nr:T9SS type A sorting domain-containing protein [Bacteroidota bacterium]
EEATGEDLTPFFEAQALQPGFSTWVVDSMSTGPENGCFATTLHLHQKLRACSGFHENEPLDVTLWNAQWDTTLVHARVGGEFDQITFQHEEPFILIGLNADGRLNQGRLDHTFAVTEPTGLSNLPWVDMRVGCDDIPEGDSVLVRVEHHWAAPDQGPAAPYVESLSDTHFWVVDGTWEEGNDNAPLLDARLNYVGNDDTDLDAGLYGDTEEGAFLAWRPRAGSTWIQYPDYDWQAGSLANGSGVFKISKLRKGQYAFAKGDVSVALPEVSAPSKPELTVMHNPTRETLRWNLPGLNPSETLVVDVFNASGQLVHSTPHADGRMDVSTWPRGTYEVRFGTEGGAIRATGTFVVAR